MKTPEHFPRVLGITYILLVIGKVGFGIAGWLAFCGSTDEVVVTNLRHLPSIMSSVAIAVNTWLTIPLIVVVLFRIIGPFRQAESSEFEIFVSSNSFDPSLSFAFTGSCIQATERTLALVVAAVIAAAVPHFALLLSIVGAVAGTMLTFVFPACFYLKLAVTPSLLLKSAAWSITVLGPIAGGYSVVEAIKALIRKF